MYLLNEALVLHMRWSQVGGWCELPAGCSCGLLLLYLGVFDFHPGMFPPQFWNQKPWSQQYQPGYYWDIVLKTENHRSHGTPLHSPFEFVFFTILITWTHQTKCEATWSNIPLEQSWQQRSNWTPCGVGSASSVVVVVVVVVLPLFCCIFH